MYTASDVLAKLLTKDGAGSSLDADKLDGQEGSYYASVASLANYLPLSGGVLTGALTTQSVSPSSSNSYDLGSSALLWRNIYTQKATIDGIEIKKSASGVLYIGGNLVVSGGITMYGTDDTTANTIWDDAPIANTNGKKGVASYDPNFFAVNNGVVTFIGSTGGGGGIDSITKQMVIDALGYTPYNSANPSGYITSSGSITGNAATATALKTPITLWGNSFDGANNVNGNISLNTNKIFWQGDSNNYYISCPADMGGAGLMYKAYSSHRFVAGGAERLTILYSGYVGVNKSSPTTAFHVNGTSTFDGDVLARDIKPQSTVEFGLGTSSYLWSGVYLGSDILTANNMKGVNFCDTSGYGVGKVGSSIAGMGVYTVGTLYLRGGCTKGSSGAITVSSTGATIDASGNMLVTGGITMYSDLRKKTILNHVELSLKEVADAPLIEHYYNSDESKRTHVGSVAQYWAGLNDWFCKEDEEGFLTMEIQNAALASAISVARELTRYESKTDKQIKKLKKRIGELEEEIENLKKV
jgi:hypothetical protein